VIDIIIKKLIVLFLVINQTWNKDLNQRLIEINKTKDNTLIDRVAKSTVLLHYLLCSHLWGNSERNLME
jgi:hypothetical protein